MFTPGKDENPNKGASLEPRQPSDVWPPPPVRPQLRHTSTSIHAGELVTGVSWLDAVLGIPAGFVIGFALWAVAGLSVQAVRKPPSHQPEMFAMGVLGFVVTAIVYILIGRKYSIFGFTLWIGGVPYYLLMLFLAWCTP